MSLDLNGAGTGQMPYLTWSIVTLSPSGDGATQLRHEELHLLVGQKTSQGCPQLQEFPFVFCCSRKLTFWCPDL